MRAESEKAIQYFRRATELNQAFMPAWTLMGHEYIELKMPAGPPTVPSGDPTFLLDPNHLHIWPRHTFMLIGLPNKVRCPQPCPSLSLLLRRG